LKSIYPSILALFIVCNFAGKAQTNAFAKNASYVYSSNEDSSEVKSVENPATSKLSPSKQRAYDRQLKTFKVNPNTANNFVYLAYYGEGMVTLHNANDSLIFKARIREKATVNIRKLPVGRYYFTDIKTGIKQEMIIAR
jgi:hypothetical protein